MISLFPVRSFPCAENERLSQEADHPGEAREKRSPRRNGTGRDGRGFPLPRFRKRKKMEGTIRNLSPLSASGMEEAVKERMKRMKKRMRKGMSTGLQYGMKRNKEIQRDV